MAEKAKNEKKEGFLKRVAHRFVKGCKDMKGEIKKVVWPSKKQIINNTAVVLALLHHRRRVHLDSGRSFVRFGESASQQRRLTAPAACNRCVTLRGGMKNV